jgi:vacuolar protein sorting-associated protein 52
MLQNRPATEFFMEIFDRTFKSTLKTAETYLTDCFDPIAILLCLHIIYRYQVIANKRNVPILNRYDELFASMSCTFVCLLRLHSSLIQLFEARFEIVMKANTDSVQRVEPHKFSSIELNPHFVCLYRTDSYVQISNVFN